MAKIRVQNETKIAFKQCNHLFPWSCTSRSGEELLWCPDCGSIQWPKTADWIRPRCGKKAIKKYPDPYHKYILKTFSV